MKKLVDWIEEYALGVLVIVCIILMGWALSVAFLKYRLDKQNAAVVAAAPVKQAEQGQALAADAVQQLDTAGRRDRLTVVIQQENARALQATQGADAPVDPQFLGALPRGLCKYAAYAADPGCADLRVVDPAKLP